MSHAMRRYLRGRLPQYVSFSQLWPNPGVGRYWKRQLSKARRRYIRQMLRLGRGKEPAGLESEVNWRTW